MRTNTVENTEGRAQKVLRCVLRFVLHEWQRDIGELLPVASSHDNNVSKSHCGCSWPDNSTIHEDKQAKSRIPCRCSTRKHPHEDTKEVYSSEGVEQMTEQLPRGH